MKKIKKKGDISQLDYILEDGTKLFACDWNGERYLNGIKANGNAWNKVFIPIYKFQLENIDITQIEENSDEWNDVCSIVGFEEL